MTVDGLREPRACERSGAVDVVRDGQEIRAADGRTTTVPVIPLWERLRTGARG
jgi:hypothetical protein